MKSVRGAKPALAHTQYAYAKMLLARAQPDDGASAMLLLDEALATSLELGMHAFEERVVALRARVRSQPCSLQPYPCGLTQREVEVLHLLVAGKSNRDIATALYISSNTVANHVRNILTKTNTTNRTEAV